MTKEEINKAIEEEAEKRWPEEDFFYHANDILIAAEKRKEFKEHCEFAVELMRTITASTNLEQQNTAQGLNTFTHYVMKGAGGGLFVWDKEYHDFYQGKVKSGEFDTKTGPNKISYGVYEIVIGFNLINPQSNPELKAEEKIQEQHSTNKTNENI